MSGSQPRSQASTAAPGRSRAAPCRRSWEGLKWSALQHRSGEGREGYYEENASTYIVCNRQLFTHSPCSHIVLVHQLFSLVDAQGPVKGGLLRGCRRAHIYQTYDLINKSNIQCSPHPRSNAMTHTQVCMYVCLIMTLTQVRRLVRQTRRGDESDTVQGGGGSGDGSNASGQV